MKALGVLHVEFVPACQEVKIGLSSPWPLVRLVCAEQGVRFVRPGTGLKCTERMQASPHAFLGDLPLVDGFLFSSCAVTVEKVYVF